MRWIPKFSPGDKVDSPKPRAEVKNEKNYAFHAPQAFVVKTATFNVFKQWSMSTGIEVVICGQSRIQLRALTRGGVSVLWPVVRDAINERRVYFCTNLTKLNVVIDRC